MRQSFSSSSSTSSYSPMRRIRKFFLIPRPRVLKDWIPPLWILLLASVALLDFAACFPTWMDGWTEGRPPSRYGSLLLSRTTSSSSSTATATCTSTSGGGNTSEANGTEFCPAPDAEEKENDDDGEDEDGNNEKAHQSSSVVFISFFLLLWKRRSTRGSASWRNLLLRGLVALQYHSHYQQMISTVFGLLCFVESMRRARQARQTALDTEALDDFETTLAGLVYNSASRFTVFRPSFSSLSSAQNSIRTDPNNNHKHDRQGGVDTRNNTGSEQRHEYAKAARKFLRVWSPVVSTLFGWWILLPWPLLFYALAPRAASSSSSSSLPYSSYSCGDDPALATRWISYASHWIYEWFLHSHDVIVHWIWQRALPVKLLWMQPLQFIHRLRRLSKWIRYFRYAGPLVRLLLKLNDQFWVFGKTWRQQWAAQSEKAKRLAASRSTFFHDIQRLESLTKLQTRLASLPSSQFFTFSNTTTTTNNNNYHNDHHQEAPHPHPHPHPHPYTVPVNSNINSTPTFTPMDTRGDTTTSTNTDTTTSLKRYHHEGGFLAAVMTTASTASTSSSSSGSLSVHRPTFVDARSTLIRSALRSPSPNTTSPNGDDDLLTLTTIVSSTEDQGQQQEQQQQDDDEDEDEDDTYNKGSASSSSPSPNNIVATSAITPTIVTTGLALSSPLVSSSVTTTTTTTTMSPLSFASTPTASNAAVTTTPTIAARHSVAILIAQKKQESQRLKRRLDHLKHHFRHSSRITSEWYDTLMALTQEVTRTVHTTAHGVWNNPKYLISPQTRFSVAWRLCVTLALLSELGRLLVSWQLSGTFDLRYRDLTVRLLGLCQTKSRPFRTFIGKVVRLPHNHPWIDTCRQSSPSSQFSLTVAWWSEFAIDLIGFLDIPVWFYTGELDAATGVVVPKPFFARCILPGTLIQVLDHPTVPQTIPNLVSYFCKAARAVGYSRVIRWGLALYPALDLFVLSPIYRYLFHPMDKEEYLTYTESLVHLPYGFTSNPSLVMRSSSTSHNNLLGTGTAGMDEWRDHHSHSGTGRDHDTGEEDDHREGGDDDDDDDDDSIVGRLNSSSLFLRPNNNLESSYRDVLHASISENDGYGLYY